MSMRGEDTYHELRKEFEVRLNLKWCDNHSDMSVIKLVMQGLKLMFRTPPQFDKPFMNQTHSFGSPLVKRMEINNITGTFLLYNVKSRTYFFYVSWVLGQDSLKCQEEKLGLSL